MRAATHVRRAIPALLVFALVALAVGGCGREDRAAAPEAEEPAVTVAVATTTPSTTVDPGTLPQTRDKPSVPSAELDAGGRALFDAIVADDARPAMSFFFPLSAYKQVKDIKNPEADWKSRLVAAFERDVHTLHGEMGTDASRAQYAGIDVPVAKAQWIGPGGEYNKIGYWRVYGTMVRYTVDGATKSLPVYSLISWRGLWYVVHLVTTK